MDSIIVKHRRFFAALALALAACGDDDDASGESSSSGDAAETTAATSAATTSGDDDGSSSSGDVSACGELPADADPCLRCGQQACTDAYDTCCALTELDAEGAPTAGCLPLVACAIATGCEHAECYDPSTCMAEIDGAGGISGDGTAAAGTLGDCMGAAIGAATLDACAECQAQTGG